MIFLEKNTKTKSPKTTGLYKAKRAAAEAVHYEGKPKKLLSFQISLDEQAKRAELKIAQFLRVSFNRAFSYAVLSAAERRGHGKFKRPRGGSMKKKSYRLIEGKRKQTLYLRAETAEAFFWAVWEINRNQSHAAAAKKCLLEYWALLAKRAEAYHFRIKAKGYGLSLRAYLKAAITAAGGQRPKPRAASSDLIDRWAALEPKPRAA